MRGQVRGRAMDALGDRDGQEEQGQILRRETPTHGLHAQVMLLGRLGRHLQLSFLSRDLRGGSGGSTLTATPRANKQGKGYLHSVHLLPVSGVRQGHERLCCRRGPRKLKLHQEFCVLPTARYREESRRPTSPEQALDVGKRQAPSSGPTSGCSIKKHTGPLFSSPPMMNWIAPTVELSHSACTHTTTCHISPVALSCQPLAPPRTTRAVSRVPRPIMGPFVPPDGKYWPENSSRRTRSISHPVASPRLLLLTSSPPPSLPRWQL